MAEKEDQGNSLNEKVERVPGLGLALGGGLARGFAHIGVLRVLERNNMRPSIVAGTSIGAVVGAAYLTDKLDEFEKWALSLSRYKVLSYLDIRMRSGGLIGGKYLDALLQEHFADLLIEDLPCPFATVSTDLATGHEVWIRKGPLIKALRASFALPGFFPPVERDGRFLVDGALINPVPVTCCHSMGAHITIGVDLHADILGKAAPANRSYPTVAGFDLFNSKDVPEKEQKRFTSGLTKRLFWRKEDNPSMFGSMVAALNIMLDRITRSRLAGDPPDIHIKPMIGHVGLMEFEKAPELIHKGEEAAEQALPDMKAALNTLIPVDKS